LRIDGNSSLAQVTGAGAKRWQDEIKRRQTDPRSTNSAAKRKQRSGTERWHLERMKPPAVQLRQLFLFRLSLAIVGWLLPGVSHDGKTQMGTGAME
jgi:hypothetical protein